MRRVMRVLDAEMEKFRQAPFFAFLKDTSIDAKKRLGFAPSIAHFVMSFADLYALVLPEHPPRDKYQELVNAHVREDEDHWKWFLSDLPKLGCDQRLSYSDALRFVWSKHTVRTRLLSYHMCRLGFQADSIRKLVLVHCIEGAGKVTVQHVAAVGREVGEALGEKLVYFGPHHSNSESEHTIEDAGVHRMVEEIELADERVEELSALVREAFEHFTGFTNDMLDFAKGGHSLGSA